MQYNIIICGVGGQGILFLSKFLILAAQKAKLNVKQSEVHGMAQRGGAVFAHLRFSDEEIYSPIIPEGRADMIISMEPLEILRYLKYTNKDTKLITNSTPVKNISNYPDEDALIKNLKNAGTIILDGANNMTLAGCASKFLPIDEQFFKDAIISISSGKPQNIEEKNLDEFKKGQKYDI